MANARVLVVHSISCKRIALCKAWPDTRTVPLLTSPWTRNRLRSLGGLKRREGRGNQIHRDARPQMEERSWRKKSRFRSRESGDKLNRPKENSRRPLAE